MISTDFAFARRADPDTSHEAAASITPDTLRDSQAAVLRVLRASGPMTDEELIGMYGGWCNVTDLPRQSDSGIRTRRKELERLGFLRDAGRKRTASGRAAIVWMVAA